MIQSRVKRYGEWMAIAVAGVTAIAASTSVAQSAKEHAPAPTGPAPLLMTVREMLKPGEEAAHAKLEAEYTTTLDAGKGDEYYLGMGAITGRQETMFVSGYASLDEMSAVHDYDETVLGAKLDSLDKEHSGTLTGTETTLWRLRPEMSNPNPESLGKMRYMEMIEIHVKLGHAPEFASMMDKIKQGWMKMDPDFHYVIYQQAFGDAKDDAYLVMISVKSLGDLDKHRVKALQYAKTVGEEEHKHLLEFEGEDYNSTVSNLYVFTPSMSRLPKSWTEDDLDFWRPKMVGAAAAAGAQK